MARSDSYAPRKPLVSPAAESVAGFLLTIAPVRTNPDFQPPPGGIAAELARMRAGPIGLARPLIVFAGWHAPSWPSAALARHLHGLVGGPESKTAGIGFPFCLSMTSAIARAVREVEARWPASDPHETTEVDVVGISMGGLIARAAAIPSPGRKRLSIARLFTLGTPHLGARLARFMPFDPLARAMRPGSEFLQRLDAALPQATFELVCYARLRDSWVGARNTAPHGSLPCWKPGPLVLSHQTITLDPLIRLDIARRLRGETPLSARASPPPSQ